MNPFELELMTRIRDGERTTLLRGPVPFDAADLLLEFAGFLQSGDTIVFTFRQFNGPGQGWITRRIKRTLP